MFYKNKQVDVPTEMQNIWCRRIVFTFSSSLIFQNGALEDYDNRRVACRIDEKLKQKDG